MKLTKSMLKKLKKDELIDLILQLQEKSEAKSLYEQAAGNNKIYEKSGSLSYKYILKPGDILEVWSEEITPSGYAKAGTENLDWNIDLKDEENYKEYLKIGFNRKLINALKKDEVI